MTVDHVWARYWGDAGSVLRLEFEAYLYGAYERDPFDLLILTWAVQGMALTGGAGSADLSASCDYCRGQSSKDVLVVSRFSGHRWLAIPSASVWSFMLRVWDAAWRKAKASGCDFER